MSGAVRARQAPAPLITIAGAVAIAAALAVSCSGLSYGPVRARGPRLLVRSKVASDSTCQEILEAAADVRKDLAAAFGEDPSQTLTICIVETMEGAWGEYRIMWPTGDVLLIHPDPAPRLAKSGVPLLVHEMSHFFIRRTQGSVPRWYTEGVGEFLCFERWWSTRELLDLPILADEMNPAVILALVSSDAETFSQMDVRPSQAKWERDDESKVARIVYRPGSHYTLSRLLIAALDAQGWPVLRENPSGRILAEPEEVARAVRQYAQQGIWAKILSGVDLNATPPSFRQAVAAGLGFACRETDRKVLEGLTADPDPGVRDQAALSLLRCGDRSTVRWVATVYGRLLSTLQRKEPVKRAELSLIAAAQRALEEITGGLRDPDGIGSYLEAHAMDLGPQRERPAD